MKKKSRFLRSIAGVLTLSVCLTMTGPMTFANEVADPVPVEETPIYLDRSYSFEERAADLLSRMTLNQKASQMISGYSSAIPELNMNWYGWWNESLHGVSRLQAQRNANATTIYNTTTYPINLAMSSTWNPELMYEVASEIGDEAREVTRDNRYELTFWSPTINLLRDSRWGRADESFGEDPLLTAKMASQFVNGMEGKDMQGNRLDENGYLKTVSTLKHYLGNNSENNRLNGSTNITEKELREYYSYVYRLIVEESDVSSVMSSYNRVNEVPQNLNNYTLDTLLRQTFGFSGYITGDCDSIGIAQAGSGYDQNPLAPRGNGHGWRLPETGEKITGTETVAWAINAGGDLQCNNGYSNNNTKYSTKIPAAVEEGITTPSGIFDENSVDVSLLRLLTARMALGEFDVEDGVVSWYNQARERIAENYGEDWVYDLTNGGRDNGIDTITQERKDLMLESAQEALVLLKNSPAGEGDAAKALLPIAVPEGAFKVVVVGANSYVNPSQMFLGGYSPNMNDAGRSVHVTPYNGLRKALLEANPDADVSLIEFANNTDAISEEQLASLADADLVIFYAGTTNRDGDEARDRSTLELPGVQTDNIVKVTEANPNTVVVMETISPAYISRFAEKAPAIVWSCYNGMLKGDALADALLGDVNFSGRTSTIWLDSDDQMLSTFSYRLTPGEDSWPYPENTAFAHESDTYTYGDSNGRTYMYYDEEKGGPVRYPFGYGLSYSDFAYSNLVVEGLTGDSIDANGTLRVSVDVTNTSDVDGAEVVQLYMATPGAPAELQHPNNRLVGFDKVFVPAGETKTVNLEVDIEDLAFFIEEDNRFEVYNGAYQLQVNKNHKEIELTKDFTVTGALTPKISVVTAKAVQNGDKEKDIPHRVRFDLGKTVDPQLTIAMSDDTLYGYVMKGQSRDIPENFEITYESNRPNIVSVEDGVIRTRKSGVATITATVTDPATGSVGACDFVVLVVPGDGPQLSDLAINGKTLENFEPGLRSYTYAVPLDAKASDYTITATALDGSEIVGITQLESIPGEAKVTVDNGDAVMDYVIRFIFDEPQILNAVAENGKLTVTMNMLPEGELSIEDFSAIIALDAFEGSVLTLSDMHVDEAAKTVTFSYPPVTKTEKTQVVTISVAYKHTPAASFIFDLEADPDLMYAIQVGGEPLPGFRYSTKSYTYTVLDGEDIPEVTATAIDSGTTVNVVQASDLYESAKVEYTVGGQKESFLITFVPESTTRFTSLPDGWEILNGNGKETYSEAGITLPPSNLANNNDFPSESMLNMLQYNGSLGGDWTATVKVTTDRPLTHDGYANYGIGINNGGKDYIKLVQLSSGGNPSYQYTASFQSNNTHIRFAYTTAWLRLTKVGTQITGSISSDGVNFTNISTFDAGDRLDGAKLQLFATTNQSNSEFYTTFEYIDTDLQIKEDELAAERKMLQDLIDAIDGVYEKDRYTAASWSDLADALDEAKAVVDKEDATKEELIAAYLDLVSARDGLEYAPDTSLLELAVSIANDLLEKGTLDTDSENALKAAVKDAKAVLNDADATQEEINEAFNAVMMAIVESQPEYTLEDLLALIEYAEGLNEDKYTSSSYEDFSEVLKGAKEVAGDSEANDAAISDAYNALLDALGKLEFCVDYGNLKTAYGFAASLPEDKYDLSSVEGLLDLMDEAAEVLDAHDLVHSDENQTYVDDLAKELTVAVSKLRLRTAIAAANDLLAEIDEDDYTAASVANLKAALTEAIELDEAGEYEAAAVEVALNKLEAAMDLKPAGNDKPSRPSGSSNSGSNSQVADSDYWEEVIEKINATEKGGKVNAKLDEGANVPATVIDALKNKGVTVVFEIGGKDYAVNGAGELKGYNAAAVYYTSDEIKAMAGGAAAEATPTASSSAAPEASNETAAVNPETGGEVTAAAPAAPEAVIPAAPEAPVAIEPVAPAVPAEENIQAIAEAAEAETGMPAWMIAAIVVVAAAAVGGVSLTVIRRKREN